MSLELKIRPWFEYAKKYNLYGHENKISNTTIINKFKYKMCLLKAIFHSGERLLVKKNRSFFLANQISYFDRTGDRSSEWNEIQYMLSNL